MTIENLPEVPEKITALEVYQIENGLDPWIAKIRKEVESFIPDVTTKKGRDAIASIAYKVAKSKTALDNLGKELVAELKELPKKIDAERARVRNELDALRDSVRKPLTDWEEAEASRICKHQVNIGVIKKAAQDLDEMDSCAIKSRIEFIESIITDAVNFEEFELEAIHAKENTLKQLKQSLLKREQYELEQAELAKLRAEAAAREQAEKEAALVKLAEERAKKDAEEKARKELEAVELEAKAERDAAEKRELELRLKAEQAEREKLEAEQKAARAIEQEKERARLEAERVESERIAREKDRQHIAAINRESMQCFIDGGMTEECAKLAVTLIAKKLIKNIHIEY